MENCRCIIVVPVYKQELNPFEIISLRQLNNVLGHYPISFIAPQSLVINYGELSSGCAVERFPDRYFTGTAGYSDLLTSVEFYQRFENFEYMLIHQLDAFVFSDKLLDFCATGVDYIGAPLPQWWWTGSGIYGNGIAVVGNGGFSLRKVKSCLQVVSQKRRILWKRTDAEALCKDEDKFFGLCSTIPFLNFRSADISTAMSFSIEFDVAGSYNRVKEGHLPFGCHGWFNSEFDFWRPFIKQYGYTFAECDIQEYTQSMMSERIYRDALNHLLLWMNQERLVEVRVPPILAKRTVAVWGAGDVGRRIIRLLDYLGVKNYIVLSKNPVAGMPTLYPSHKILADQDYFFILASTKFETEMCKALVCAYRQHEKDFATALEIETELVRHICPDNWQDYGLLEWRAGETHL